MKNSRHLLSLYIAILFFFLHPSSLNSAQSSFIIGYCYVRDIFVVIFLARFSTPHIPNNTCNARDDDDIPYLNYTEAPFSPMQLNTNLTRSHFKYPLLQKRKPLSFHSPTQIFHSLPSSTFISSHNFYLFYTIHNFTSSKIYDQSNAALIFRIQFWDLGFPC